jgi:hypothetical protein
LLREQTGHVSFGKSAVPIAGSDATKHAIDCGKLAQRQGAVWSRPFPGSALDSGHHFQPYRVGGASEVLHSHSCQRAEVPVFVNASINNERVAVTLGQSASYSFFCLFVVKSITGRRPVRLGNQPATLVVANCLVLTPPCRANFPMVRNSVLLILCLHVCALNPIPKLPKYRVKREKAGSVGGARRIKLGHRVYCDKCD